MHKLNKPIEQLNLRNISVAAKASGTKVFLTLIKRVSPLVAGPWASTQGRDKRELMRTGQGHLEHQWPTVCAAWLGDLYCESRTIPCLNIPCYTHTGPASPSCVLCLRKDRHCSSQTIWAVPSCVAAGWMQLSKGLAAPRD